MGGFFALDALQLLRRRAADGLLIIVSDGIGEELAIEAIKQGAGDHIRKDHLTRLGAKAHRALVKKEMRDERRRIDARLRRASLHDQLTGLCNRAHFDEELGRRGRARDGKASEIVADVDTLKTVNDRRGHATGDELRLNTALLLGSALRRDDVVARSWK